MEIVSYLISIVAFILFCLVLVIKEKEPTEEKKEEEVVSNIIKPYDFDKKLYKVCSDVQKVVGSTFGSGGRNVVIPRVYNSPLPSIATKDGVSVLDKIIYKDKDYGDILNIIRETAKKNLTEVGDGTTLATLLITEYIRLLHRYNVFVDNKFESEINKFTTEELPYILDHYKIKVETLEDIETVALTSSNGDKEITKLIKDAYNEVGENGLITLGFSSTNKDTLNFIKGLSINLTLINDKILKCKNVQNKTSYNPKILILDKFLNIGSEIVNIAQSCANEHKDLIIIADGFSDELISMTIQNASDGLVNIFLLKNNYMNETKENILKDICIYTDTEIINKQNGYDLMNLKDIRVLGECEEVKFSTSFTTILLNGNGSEEKINERVEELKEQLKDCKDEELELIIKEEIAKLTGGVCQILISGESELKKKEKYDRLEDSLCAVRSSIEKGAFVGGGGIWVLLINKLLDDKFNCEDKYKRQVYNILINLFTIPLYVLLYNNNTTICEYFDIHKGEKNFKYKSKRERIKEIINIMLNENLYIEFTNNGTTYHRIPYNFYDNVYTSNDIKVLDTYDSVKYGISNSLSVGTTLYRADYMLF